MTTTAPETCRPTFWADGACQELPAGWFHPERGESTREAKAVCATCTVRAACLAWALDNHEKFGIWGGTSERERRRIHHKILAGEPIPELDEAWAPTSRWPLPPPPPTREEPTVDLTTVTPDPATTNGHHPAGNITATCVNCGKTYTPNRKTQRFHSKECARAWYAAHPRETGPKIPKFPPAPEPTTRQAIEPATPDPDTPTSPVDIQALLGQLLTGSDRWTIEADLGDIRIAVTRGSRP